MSTTNNEESIDLACKGLEVAVKKYCRKRKRDFHSTTKTLVQHASHILRRLHEKQISLSQGLSCLEQSWKTWINVHTSAETTTAMLKHFLYQYLRLHDGLNLLTSGECRHDGDIEQAKCTKFPSRLNRQTQRNDGYTKLYSSQYYSGYGWDEFFDPSVGVQKLLQQALGSDNSWDILLDYGAQAFESCLDQHEVDLQVLHRRFEALRSMVGKRLQQDCSSVNFISQDKMERLEVTLKNSGTHIALKRQANAFQVHDPKGCLPSGWLVADWKRAMEPPCQRKAIAKTKVTKKRRTPQDSDDVKVAVATHAESARAVDGLHVEVKRKTKETKKDEILDVSLVTLKGGEENAAALEKSREALEAEEAGGVKPIEIHQAIDETAELKYDIKDARIKVERMKRVMARIQAREDEYDDELWDARECLREAAMTLGSDLLSLCAVDKDTDSKEKNLQEARDCFRQARDLVKKQEEIHQMICRQSNDVSEGARAIRRKLLLLRGRAHVNFGIALVESSRTKCSEIVRKGFETEAATELECAEGCAVAIRARAVTDDTRGASPSEIAMDRIEADQLDSLVNRWLGNSLWLQRRPKEAVVAFKKSSRFFIDRRNSGTNEDTLEAELLELGMECFFSCMSLADLALNSLEKLQIVVEGHPKRHDCLTRGEELFSMAKEAFARASLITGNMHKVARHKSDILRENGVLTLREIAKHTEEMHSWWEEKKRGVLLCHSIGNSESDPLRNDLFSSGQPRPTNIPVKRFIVNESASRRASRRRPQGGSGSSRSIRAASNLVGAVDKTSNANVQYRPWGDALLPQMKTESGEMVPHIVYPAAAPELPPGFKPFRPNL